MKTEITAKSAPQAIGPYSQAIKSGNLVFCSGQIPVNPHTGELSAPSIKGQTHQVMQNMKEVLAAAGLTFEHVLKTTIYLTDMDDFNVVNEIYAEYIGSPAPARACIQVAALPKKAKIEIECIASTA
ncbi:MAG: RidA family protein [Desulfuromonadaceae bacterium]|nr:RidA family protein [Desulfuromonadaceae bacterium]